MNRFTPRIFLLGSVVLAIIGIVVIANFRRSDVNPRPALTEATGKQKSEVVALPERDSSSKTRLSEALGISEDQVTRVGGVQRPKRDIGSVAAEKISPSSGKSSLRSAGSLPRLTGTENPQVAGLLAELQSEEPPRDAASAMFLPEEFDPEAYKADPESYLNQIRPGRVFQPAQPGTDVVPISAASRGFTSLLQGERAVLRVRATPGNPVTFYTPDGGEFDNRLKTISVAANENGIAEVAYTAVPGTRGIMDVVAASPLHSGQARFAVKVVLPNR